jgi:hypothetical protein
MRPHFRCDPRRPKLLLDSTPVQEVLFQFGLGQVILAAVT